MIGFVIAQRRRGKWAYIQSTIGWTCALDRAQVFATERAARAAQCRLLGYEADYDIYPVECEEV